MDFRIRQLQCFLTLSELLNYGKTARALYISQPTITFQIQTLEDAFGAKLFERDRKQVRLTDAGSALRKYAQNILDTIETAQEHLAGINSQLHVRTAWEPIGFFDLLPVVLRVLLARYPLFDLDVQDLTSEQQISHLSEHKIDAIVMAPSMPIAGAAFHPLCRVPVVALVSRNSPFAKCGSISVHHLRDTHLIATRTEDSRFQQPFIASLLDPYGVHPKIIESPQSWAVQSAYVAAGAGIVIAPRSSGYEDLPDVMPIPFIEPLPWIELGCMVMENNHSEALAIFRRVVTRCAHQPLPGNLKGKSRQAAIPTP